MIIRYEQIIYVINQLKTSTKELLQQYLHVTLMRNTNDVSRLKAQLCTAQSPNV